jgi:protocatechuate 3,4-dioxygenase, beta subunit
MERLVMKRFERMLDRRRLLELLLASGVTLGSGQWPRAFAQTSETPNMVLGPFYPMVKPIDDDADLTRVRGRKGRAAGQIIELSGRVLNRAGKPVRNARIELWQTNTHGRYVHSSDPNVKAPVDPNFQGYAVQSTDELGRYRFKTVKPGPYPSESGEFMRAAHIHFDVMGKTDRKVTQMYFPSDPMIEQDRVYLAARGNKSRLFGVVQRSARGDEISVVWDITLRNG